MTTKAWTSRAVTRQIEAGLRARCAYCNDRILFQGWKQGRRYRVIANVYESGRWDRVEEFHDSCYQAAGEPKRIQMRRTRGWRKPEGAVYVGRPSRWGNWYVVRRNTVVVERDGRRSFVPKGDVWIVVSTNKWGHETGPHWGAWTDQTEATRFAVELFRRSLEATYVELDGDHHRRFYLDGLRGHDLFCWCKPEAPCHADVLLELANS